MIIYKNVQKSYGDREIIRDVNFTVEQGEFVVMIGRPAAARRRR